MRRLACGVMCVVLFSVFHGFDASADDANSSAVRKPFHGNFRENLGRKILNRLNGRNRVRCSPSDVEEKSEQVEDRQLRGVEKLIHVVDPEGAPIAGATGEILFKEEIGATDKNGDMVLEIKSGNKATIKAKGFIPFVIDWRQFSGVSEPPFPNEVTAQMTRSVRLAGTVQDTQGRVLKGAVVKVRSKATTLPGVPYTHAVVEEVITDAQGRWNCDMAPKGGEVTIEVKMDGVTIRDWRNQPVESLTHNTSCRNRGFTVPVGRPISGCVLDPDGQPAANADVYMQHSVAFPRTKTDASGKFQFSYCTGDRLVLTAWSPSFAPTALEIGCDDTDPVELRLSVGHPMQIRVVDQDGKPLSGAKMGTIRWMPCYAQVDDATIPETDVDGISIWKSAPNTGALSIGVYRRDYTSLRKIVRASEEMQTLTMYGKWTASGRVVDAETKKPIPSFRVKLGYPRLRYGTEEPMEDVLSGSGEFSISADRISYTTGALRIEAKGYQPFATDTLERVDGDVAVNVELRKVKMGESTLLLPDGRPAAGAEILVVPPGIKLSRTIMSSQNFPRHYYPKTLTDEQGRFRTPEEMPLPYELIISHDEGCAVVLPEDLIESKPIRLKPWSRIEGVICLNSETRSGEIVEANSFINNHTTTFTLFEETDTQGRFVLEQVFPGCYKTSRSLPLMIDGKKRSNIRTHGKTIQCEPGETTNVVLGGTGIDVRGTIQPQPVEMESYSYTPPIVKLLPIPAVVPWPDELKDLPDDDETKLRWLWDWREEPADIDFGGSDPEVAYRFYRTWAEKDGSYLLKCVPPGEYVMTVWQHRYNLTTGKNEEFIAMEDKVVVPSDETTGGTLVVHMNHLGAEVIEATAAVPAPMRRTPIRSWIRKKSARFKP